jgi:3-methyladenine DNA glycosylase AlkD
MPPQLSMGYARCHRRVLTFAMLADPGVARQLDRVEPRRLTSLRNAPLSFRMSEARSAAPVRLPDVRCCEVINRLRLLGDPDRLEGMARYGIATGHAYGVSIPELRGLATEVRSDHQLALSLWDSSIHEARILASMIDDPALVDEAQMERWAGDLDSWDLCDQVCANLFRHTPFAYAKASEWSSRAEQFVKRAGFALIAGLAVADKRAPDERFAAFLPLVVRESGDDRNLVKKAVNWALRQIGKRNQHLNALAIDTALELQRESSKSAHWIAADALRELRSQSVQDRLGATR